MGARKMRRNRGGDTLADAFGFDTSFFEVGRYRDDVDLDSDSGFHFSRLQPSEPFRFEDAPEDHVYLSPGLGYSDYTGTAVEQSNVDAFLEEHKDSPGVYMIYGDGGSTQIGVRATVDDEDIIESIGAIESEHVLSDDAYNAKVRELEDAAYENGARDDFLKAVEKNLGIEMEIDHRTAKLFRQALTWAEEAGATPSYIEQGGNVVFPIDEMGAAVEPDDVKHASLFMGGTSSTPRFSWGD